MARGSGPSLLLVRTEAGLGVARDSILVLPLLLMCLALSLAAARRASNQVRFEIEFASAQ
jgi:hypothetical protein